MGDVIYASRRKTIPFFRGLRAWEGWLDGILAARSVDLIILFGSERPAHVVARRLADLYGVKILSLEEGYIRPGLITLEEAGNNASSPIAGQLPPEEYSGGETAPDKIDYKSFRRMSWCGATYYIARTVTALGSQKELYHRKVHAFREIFCWLRNAYRRLRGQWRNFTTIQSLLEYWNKKYFIIVMQVAADANLAAAALGWDSARLISSTITSFARSAPTDSRLVFKIHPMERGHNTYTPLIRATASALGIGERVDVIDIGSMGLLARHAAGMITINSSSGLSAIFHGTPLLVIGRAIYANPALATCGNGAPDFDSFWRGGLVADGTLRTRYLQWLTETCLVPGDYYVQSGMETACKQILEFITAGAVTRQPDVSLGLAN
jgi:capsular polysaccharide export protein